MYPRINKPVEDRGQWKVVIERAPGNTRELKFSTKDQALSAIKGLEGAAEILIVVRAEIRNIKGPHYDKSIHRWVLRWTENGNTRSSTSTDRDEVASKKRDLLGQQKESTPIIKQIKRFDGSPDSFKKAINQAMISLNAAVLRRNREDVELIRKYVSGISELSHASSQHNDYIEVVQNLETAIEYIEGIKKLSETGDDAGKSATRKDLISTLRGRNKSKASICGPGDPVQN